MTDEVVKEEKPVEDDVRALAEEQGLPDDLLKEIFDDEPEKAVDEVVDVPDPEEAEADPEAAPEAVDSDPRSQDEKINELIRARDGIIGEKNAIRKELAEVKARLEEQTAPAPESEEELDEYQSLLRDVQETKETQQQIQDRLDAEREVAQLRVQLQQAGSYRAQHEEKFVEEVPTYREDVDTARRAVIGQLINQGLATQDAINYVAVEEAKFTIDAQRRGINPAEALYGFLKQNGLVAAGEAEAGPEAKPLAPKKAQKKSLSNVGGSPPLGGNSMEEWMDNNPDEFAKIAEDPEKLAAFVEKYERA